MSAYNILPITVVIPLYNKARYIKRAISSVLRQTYPHFELIVVDDGSTDNSFNCASEVVDPRLRIIQQTNSGPSAARNRGVAEARHQWVAFLDADDEWKQEFLELIVELHSAFPTCKLLASAFIHSRESGLDNTLHRSLEYPTGWQGVIKDYYKDLLNPPFNASCVVVEKELLKKIGGFPLSLRKGEDTNTWIRMYQETEFAFVNIVGAVYHLEAENRSNPHPTLISNNPRHPYSHALLLDQFIREGKISPDQIQSAIEFMAANDLPISQQLLEQGYRREARQRLWTYRGAKRYRKRWLRLFVKSFLPLVAIHIYKHLTINK